MKFTSRITILLFSALLVFSSHSARALDEASLSQMLQELQAENPEKLSDELSKKAYDHINRIICAHTDLASLIQEDAIKTKDKESKTALLNEFINTQKVISHISKQLIQSPTRSQLHKILNQLDDIVSHLQKALATDITKYKAFNFGEDLPHFENVNPELVKRSRPLEEKVEIEEEELEKQLEQADQDFKKIAKKAENAGLHYYNHLYRNTVDKFIIAPCDKYNLHWKALGGALSLGVVAYLWYQFNECTDGVDGQSLPKRFLQCDAGGTPALDGDGHYIPNHVDSSWFKRAFQYMLGEERGQNWHEAINKKIRCLGWPEKMSLKNNFGQAGEGQGLLCHLETSFVNYTTGYLPAAAGMWYLTDKFGLKDFAKEKFDKMHQNMLTLHNWLKGGAYYQRYKHTKKSFRIEPRFTFDDIIGLDHAKQVLGDIVKYIQDPESYDRAGLTPAMGYLLFGPTRTGKSMIAEGLAGELQKIKGHSDDFPFFVIEARYIAAEGNFNMIMNIIKNYAPCIIFIDEIDMLPLHRDKNKGKNTVLQEFLSTISGCMTTNNPDKQVIIIAATNRPENLDKSLRSRLSVHIPFEYPSFIHRAEHLIREIEGKGLPIDQFDIRKLAEQTEGASFQALHEVVNNAQFITREQGRPITQVDIEKSLNTEIRNIIYHDYANLSEEDQHTLAVHMAGHALGYMLIESKAAQLSQVTIRPVKTKIEDDSIWADCFKDHVMPDIQYGHVFTHYAGDSLKFTSKKELKRLCMIELAGRVAEDVMLDSQHTTKDTCSCHDATKAFYWARKYHLNGLDEQLLQNSKALQDKVVEQAYAFMHECEQEVRELLEPRKELIEFVAEGLKKFEILGNEEVQALVDLHKMMDGRSVDEFLKEIQGDNAEEPSEKEPSDSPDETKKAVKNELGIDEVVAEKA